MAPAAHACTGHRLSGGCLRPRCTRSTCPGTGRGRARRAPPGRVEAAPPGTAPAETLATLVAWWYSPDASPRLRQLAARGLAATNASVLHGDFLACDAFDVMDRLGAIDRPAFGFVGEDEHMYAGKH